MCPSSFVDTNAIMAENDPNKRWPLKRGNRLWSASQERAKPKTKPVLESGPHGEQNVASFVKIAPLLKMGCQSLKRGTYLSQRPLERGENLLHLKHHKESPKVCGRFCGRCPSSFRGTQEGSLDRGTTL